MTRAGGGHTRPPRWRCLVPGCPRRRWQTVGEWGEYDDLDVALGELEEHLRREHPDQRETAA